MTNHALLPLLLAVGVTGCSQLPTKADSAEAPAARYVEAAAVSDADTDTCIITVVKLRHLSVSEARRRLQGTLPAGVRTAGVGANQLVLQGRGADVATAVAALERLDG